MQIQEFERNTGLDRATIRYYEAEGLIAPVRRENGYRDYSDEDLQAVQKIKLLRQMDIPIETIKSLQQGTGDLQEVLQNHMKVLQNRVADAERAVYICKQIQASGDTYVSIDAVSYLHELEQQAKNQPKPTTLNYHEQKALIPFYPWRRLIARIIDYMLVHLLVHFFMVVVLRIHPDGFLVETLISIGGMILSVPLTALMLSTVETTPGKWIMGIHIGWYTGGKLTYGEALRREWLALRYGMGFGIPIYQIVRIYLSYRDYRDYSETEWDRGCFQRFTYWGSIKKCLLVLFVLVYLASSALIGLDSVLPKHRCGDLTVAQFAKNYNHYLNIFDEDSERELSAEGKWPYIDRTNQYGTAIYIDISAPDRENANFDYTLEGDKITKISYHNSWTDFQFVNPLGDEFFVASLAMVMSQQGMYIDDMYAFAELWAENQKSENGKIVYENIEITWLIQTENCLNVNYGYMGDGDDGHKLSFQFQIVVN